MNSNFVKSQSKLHSVLIKGSLPVLLGRYRDTGRTSCVIVFSTLSLITQSILRVA